MDNELQNINYRMPLKKNFLARHNRIATFILIIYIATIKEINRLLIVTIM